MTRRSPFREDRLLVLSYRHLAGKRGQAPFVRSTLRAVPANGACPLFPANRKLKSELRRLSAEKSDGGEFALSNPAPKPKLWRGDESENTRQTVLLSGLDCLPGQQDLFAADGDGWANPAGAASRGWSQKAFLRSIT